MSAGRLSTRPHAMSAKRMQQLVQPAATMAHGDSGGRAGDVGQQSVVHHAQIDRADLASGMIRFDAQRAADCAAADFIGDVEHDSAVLRAPLIEYAIVRAHRLECVDHKAVGPSSAMPATRITRRSARVASDGTRERLAADAEIRDARRRDEPPLRGEASNRAAGAARRPALRVGTQLSWN